MESWSSDVITFDPKIIDESKRIIEGIATAPVYDRVNELITADAIKKALPTYMKLPVVTVAHRDYVVGITKSAKILDDGSLRVRVQLKDTPDVDNVWNLIKSGVLNSFSISGTRTSSNCKNDGLYSPCVTDGIYLSTITICGDDRANPKATIDYINKTLFGEEMTEDNKEIVESPIEKTVEDTTPGITSALLEAVTELKKTVSEFAETKKESPKLEVEDEFKKTISELATSVDSIKGTLTDLEGRLSNIENRKIEKGGIIIDESGRPKAVGNILVEDYIMNRFSGARK